MEQCRKVLGRADRILMRFSALVVFAAVIVLLISVTLGVFFRYALHNSLLWTTELSSYLLLYIVFFGSAIGLRQDMHVKVEIEKLHFPAWLLKICHVLAICTIYVFIAVIVVFGYLVTVNNMGSLSVAMHLPLGYVYLAIPVSGLIMLISYTNKQLNSNEKALPFPNKEAAQ